MTKEFTVAAVAVFSFFLVGGGGCGGAVFGAAVFIRTLFVSLVFVGSASLAPVTFAVGITAAETPQRRYLNHSVYFPYSYVEIT